MFVVGLSTALQGTCVHALHGVCDWRVVVLVRTALGLVFAIALLKAAGGRLPFPGPRELWGRSAAGAISFLCTFYAAAHIPVAEVTVLLNTAPVWILLASGVVFRHRLRTRSWLAIAGGSVGILLIARPRFAEANLGAIAAACSGLLGAISLIAINRLRTVVSAPAIVAHASAAALLSSSIAVGTSIRTLDLGFVRSPGAVALLVGVAFFGTLSQVGITRAYASGNATKLAPLQYLAVAFATLSDFVFFDHAPDAITMLGIGLIVAPMLFVMLRRKEGATVRHATFAFAPDVDRATIARLEDAVGRAERLTSCEVRVHLEDTCEDRVHRPRAVFGALGMTKTKLRNGVLVYLALESRVCAVVVDEGIEDLVPPKLLDEACARLSEGMKDGEVTQIVADEIVALFGLLGRYFPYQLDDVNELDDAVSLGGDVQT